MMTAEPGWITDRILQLGSRQFCVYLVRGEVWAMLGASVAWEVPRLEGQMARFGIDRQKIRYLVISHSHHDHCTGAPYLVRRYPHIRTVASPYGAHILKKPSAVALIGKLVDDTLATMDCDRRHHGIKLDFSAINITQTVGTGDQIDLGNDTRLDFFLTPGHSRCSLSVYLPQDEVLFPADAVPFPNSKDDNLIVTATHDYNAYLQSLELLAPLPVQRVAFDHGGVIGGPYARTLIGRGITATVEQRRRIVERFGQLQDLDGLVDEISAKYHRQELFKRVPLDIMTAIVARMVKSALGLV